MHTLKERDGGGGGGCVGICCHHIDLFSAVYILRLVHEYKLNLIICI